MANEIQILNNGDSLYDIRNKINDNFALTKEFIIIMLYEQSIPLDQRISNKLYFQYTDIDNTEGRFEDYEGNILVSSVGGGVGAGGLPMFAPIWSDHLYNDASYLRADTFSWHNSSIYVTAYNILVEQYNNGNSVELVENGITYKLTPAGFKIADSSQHDKILQLYQDSGIAWFYILDTLNARFKLPREITNSGRYLYFYVGSYVRPETEINIGILTELANGTDMAVIVNEINGVKNQAINEIKATGVDWGSIKGLLNNQTDLIGMLESKASTGDLLTRTASLQTQIDGLLQQVTNLQMETATMLGRMDFSNSVIFTVNTNTSASYTCPRDGYVQFNYIDNTNNAISVNINGRKFASGLSVGNGLTSIFPVSSGDVITIGSSVGGTLEGVFIPQK